MSDKEEKTNLKKITVDGYEFTCDTDLIDDVETFELVDRIENKKQIVAIVPFLQLLIGDVEYSKMKTFFAQKDAEEHKDQPNYKARFRLSKLTDVYQAIIEQFDPKG